MKIVKGLINRLVHPEQQAKTVPEGEPKVSDPTRRHADLKESKTEPTQPDGQQRSTAHVADHELQSKPSTSALDLRTVQSRGDDLFVGLKQSQLTQGAPFSERLAEKIEKVAGIPLTNEGLSKLYANCIPNTHVTLTEIDANDETFGFMVSWLDHSGKEIARAGRELKRHEDGHLELHLHSVWVDPGLRGHAVSAKAMAQEIELLRGLSSDPNTCLSLRAGNMTDVNDKENTQSLGAYTWANFGFDFADTFGMKPYLFYGPRCEDDPGRKRKTRALTLLRRHFGDWVDEQVKAGVLPNDAQIIDKLKAAAEKWHHPWEIATFRVPGLDVQTDIGGRQVPCGLGKAFLTSPQTVFWDGVLFVNKSRSTGLHLYDAYSKRSLEKGAHKQTQERAELSTELENGNHEHKLAAIDTLARLGSKEWIPALLAARRSDPSVSDAVSRALEMIAGEHVSDGRRALLHDPNVESRERARALMQLAEIEGKTDMTLVRELLHDPNAEIQRTGLNVLARLEYDHSPQTVVDELVPVLTASEGKKFYDLFLRNDAVELLAVCGEPGFAAIRDHIGREKEKMVLETAQAALVDEESPLAKECMRLLEEKIGPYEPEVIEEPVQGELTELDEKIRAVELQLEELRNE